MFRIIILKILLMRFYRFHLSQSFFSEDKCDQLNELSDYFSDNLELIQQRFEASKIRALRNKCSDEVIEFIKKSHVYCIKALLNIKKISSNRIKKNTIPRLDDVTATVERNNRIREKFVSHVNFIMNDIQKRANQSFLLSIGDTKDIYMI